MRNFDVYLYSECPVEQNPQNLPQTWVWKVVQVTSSAPVAQGAIRMTLHELRDYKASQRTTINTWVSQQVAAETVVRKKVKKAIEGASTLIMKFASENVMNGITQQGKTKIVADALKEVMYYAQTGSLYEALTALDNVVITEQMSPFLTEAKRQELRNSVLDLINSL